MFINSSKKMDADNDDDDQDDNEPNGRSSVVDPQAKATIIVSNSVWNWSGDSLRDPAQMMRLIRQTHKQTHN